MKSHELISVRSNCNFSLDYKSGKLIPMTEVVLITSEPKYVLNKQRDGFKKDVEINEYRFISDLDGINQLIGELQLLVNNINKFEQTAVGINTIIQSAKEANTSTD